MSLDLGCPPTNSPPPAPRPADPYLDWAIATNFRHLGPGRWLPVLVEFDATALSGQLRGAASALEIPADPLRRFADLGWLDNRSLAPAVRVPELFRNPPKLVAAARTFSFSVLLIDRTQIGAVLGDPGWARTIVSASLGPPVDLAEDRSPASAATTTGTSAGTSADGSDAVEAAGALAARVAAHAVGNSLVRPATMPSGLALKSSDQRVVIAVLDEGIAFAHDRFRVGPHTRVGYFWKQDGVNGRSPGPNLFGTELTAAEIDAALAAHQVNGRVDEDLLYQRLGAVDFARDGYKAIARRRAHGTHVLDLAAGLDRRVLDLPVAVDRRVLKLPAPIGKGVEPGARPIIAVELPEALVADPVGLPLYAFVLAGMLYVLDRTEALRAEGELLPIVLNLSYGPFHGPHDGSSPFERAVDALVALARGGSTPLDVVFAAGNSRQSRAHAHLRLQPKATATIGWRMQPEDRTPSFVEFWLPAEPGAAVALRVRSPRDEVVQVSAAQPIGIFSDAKGEVFRAVYMVPSAQQSRPSIVVIAQPTATDPPLDAAAPTAAPGLWTIEVSNPGAAPVTIDGWIWRDGPISGRRPRGRQSYFDDPAYRRFEPDGRRTEFDPPSASSYIKRSGTLSGIATGTEPFVVGGYRRVPSPRGGGRPTGVPAIYSSMGPGHAHPSGERRGGAAAPAARGPNAVAPSEDSIVCHGVLSAGTRSGSVAAMNGTSVAAPQFARWLANEIAAGRRPATPIPRPPLIAPPTEPPGPFVPPVLVDASCGNGLLSMAETRIKRR